MWAVDFRRGMSWPRICWGCRWKRPRPSTTPRWRPSRRSWSWTPCWCLRKKTITTLNHLRRTNILFTCDFFEHFVYIWVKCIILKKTFLARTFLTVTCSSLIFLILLHPPAPIKTATAVLVVANLRSGQWTAIKNFRYRGRRAFLQISHCVQTLSILQNIVEKATAQKKGLASFQYESAERENTSWSGKKFENKVGEVCYRRFCDQPWRQKGAKWRQ